MSYLKIDFLKQVQWFLMMEYRFIIRSARPRKVFILTLLSPLFWFNFSIIGEFEEGPLFFLEAFTILCIGAFAYAQYFFSWQASFMISLASLPVNWTAYFVARIIPIFLITIYSAIPACLFFLNTANLPAIFAISFYLLGSVPACVLLQNARGTVCFDENKKGFFSNWIGKTVHQYIMEGILFGIPALVFGIALLVNKVSFLSWYLYLVGMVSLMSLPFLVRRRCRDKIWLERIVEANEKYN